MFREKIDPKSKKKPSMCQKCRLMPCNRLYWIDFIVLPGFFDIPLNCPKRIRDLNKAEMELRCLDEDTLSTMMGKVWAAHNYGPRYVDMGNVIAEEMDNMLSHFQRKQCSMLSIRQMPEFKPWKLFGFFANFVEYTSGMPPVIDRGIKKETPVSPTDIMADEAPAQKLPLKIVNLRWEHVTEQLKINSPDITNEEDTIKLLADIENYVEGAGVDFFISDMSSGTKKQIKKIHTNCKSNAANVEWVVDVSKAGDVPDIVFEVEARSLLRGPCEIKIENEITFQITLPIDPNDEKSQDDTIRLFSTDDAKTYNQTQTIKDDKKTDDKFLTLDFPNVDTTLKYSLEVDTGAEGKIYFQFENMTVEEVSNGSL